MALAYLLQHRRVFSAITQRLMQDWNGQFTSYHEYPGRSSFPKDLLRLLPANALCKSIAATRLRWC